MSNIRNKPPFLAPLRGFIAVILVTVWLVICTSFFLPVSLIKMLIPFGYVQRYTTNYLLGWVWMWIGFVNIMGRWISGIHIDVEGLDEVKKKGHYFILSNHCAWVDIVVLFHLYHGRMPFPRWFMKRELIWIPLIGYVCWAVDMPFMYRVTPDKVKKNPKLKGKDMEVTKRSCEKFRHRPVVVTNYLEGTRFTKEKHARQKSPYKNLLMPKYGGAGFTMTAMEDLLDGIIDMTIVYPPGQDPVGWNYVLGKVRHVVVRARIIPVPHDIISKNIQENPEAKQEFRNWINAIWERKDREISEIKAELVKQYGIEYD